MTLQTLIIYIALVAIVLTGVIGFLMKGHKKWVMTFLQNFTGVLFIFSGFVKAIDPMGTAFKMEQYFTEFQYTFADTWASFLAPLFPMLSQISLLFSVVMIVFEIVLGVMLVLGHKSKLTSWLFLLLVGFFTILTGFTFLTGYVPTSANFFDFSAWGAYTETNMRVTDCGCFGDFIKLVPKTSFIKDLVLLVPAVYFVFRHKDMHQLFTAKTRSITLAAITVLLILFCLKNFYWDLPIVDFRPFKVGTDLYLKKTQEEEAAASVKIIAWKIQNKQSGEVKELPYEDYIKNFAQYPKEEWTVVEQIKTKPAIEATKVSEFSIMSPDGFDIVEEILTDSGDVFLIVAYKLKGSTLTETSAVSDTTWITDTVSVSADSVLFVKSPGKIEQRKETKEIYQWDQSYLDDYIAKVNPLMEDVLKQGAKVFATAGGAGAEKLESFKSAIGGTYEWYEADDILLKTMIRSNPGVLHIRGGKVMNMWHIKHLPKRLPLK